MALSEQYRRQAALLTAPCLRGRRGPASPSKAAPPSTSSCATCRASRWTSTYLPVKDRTASLAEIDTAMKRIGERIADKLEKKFKNNPDAAAVDDNERLMKAYRAAVLRREEYTSHIQSQEKYGKIVYSYQNDRLTIFAKYPKPGALLYQGELLPVV